jgi:tetratricopeptide (TPR) repeat protein
MTSPASPRRKDPENTFEVISDWFELHSREVTWGLLTFVVVVAVGWFYIRSKNLKLERAERAFYAAQQSVASGNMPLAESDLRKLITRYDGTPAAMEAQILLTQLLYEQGKYKEGIASLEKAASKLESSMVFGASGHLLLEAGYEQLKNFARAAKEYEAAAAKARFDADRQRFQASAANDYLLAGNVEAAKRLWTVLAADSKGTVAGEARVRLGELLAKPEPKS